MVVIIVYVNHASFGIRGVFFSIEIVGLIILSLIQYFNLSKNLCLLFIFVIQFSNTKLCIQLMFWPEVFCPPGDISSLK